MNAEIPFVVDKDIMSGTPVFPGTRVPVQSLLDYLEDGESLDLFLEDFPTVTKVQAQQVIEFLRNVIVSGDYERAA